MKFALVFTAPFWAMVVLARWLHAIVPPIHRTDWPVTPSYWLYCLAIYLCILAFAPPFVRFFRSTPLSCRVVGLTFFFLMLTGHFLASKRVTFPLVDWQMFAGAVHTDTIVFHEYVGIRRDSSRIELNPVKLIPLLDKSRFYVAFGNVLESSIVDENPRLMNTCRQFLSVLMHKHNQRYPDNQIEAVEVIRSVATVKDKVTIERSPIARVFLVRDS